MVLSCFRLEVIDLIISEVPSLNIPGHTFIGFSACGMSLSYIKFLYITFDIFFARNQNFMQIVTCIPTTEQGSHLCDFRGLMLLRYPLHFAFIVFLICF